MALLPVSIATGSSSISTIIILISAAASARASSAQPAASPSQSPTTNPEMTAAAAAAEAVGGAGQTSSWTRSNCRLMARDPYLTDRIKQMADDGKTHLIEYKLKFPDESNYTTERSSAVNNSMTFYKPSLAYRVLTNHGRLLLQMSFQRDAVSLGLLRHGVQQLTVDLVDSPPDCFAALPPDVGARAAVTTDLLVKDLTDLLPTDQVQGDQHSVDVHVVCRQIIEHLSNDVARFAFRCCPVMTSSSFPRAPCYTLTENDVIDVVYYLSAGAKLATLLFGPLLLVWLFMPGTSGLVDYVVPLTNDLRKTIFVRRVRVDNDRAHSGGSRGGAGSRDDDDEQAGKQFAQFRQLVKRIPSQQIVNVWFGQMEILVGRRQLLTEDELPVGLVRCLYESLVLCRCRPMRRSPLQTCCLQSVLGSWSSKLLWIPLPRRPDGDVAVRCCTWQALSRAVGWLVLVAAVPLPYYIRLAVFYGFEQAEMDDRQTAVDRLGLRSDFDHDLFQWLTPTHWALVAVYCSYALSILFVALLRRASQPGRVDRLVAETVIDLRHIRRSVCVRLLLAHLLLPLEKFGVVCGLAVGLVYWLVTLPVCLLVIACYSIPLVYVTGRLLIQTRCRCLTSLPQSADNAQPASLSDGVTSFESCCFLDAIISSSASKSVQPTTPVRARAPAGLCSRVAETFKLLVIGIILIVLVWSVLLLYAEAAGFMVEVAVMTSVGFVLNAGSDAARRVVLAVWCFVYVVAVYRAAVGSYSQFSRALFAAMKRRLADQLVTAAAVRHGRRRNMAFKYFSASETQRAMAGDTAVLTQGDVRADHETEDVHRLPQDSIEYRSNLLHWNITSPSLFVDVQGTAHMPRDLFTQFCRLDVVGSPRSGVRVVLVALGRVVAVGLYLVVLGLVVELSADAESSKGSEATGQTLVTLACGALPLIIHTVFTRFTANKRYETELFAGKVERTLLSYAQSWPVFDLSFHRHDQQYTGNAAADSTASQPEVGDGEQSRPLLSDVTELKSASPRRPDENHARVVGSRDVDPSHVDLLITIRDDDSGPTTTKPGVTGNDSTGDRAGSPAGRGADGSSPLHGNLPASSAISAASTRQSTVSSRSSRPRSVTIDEGSTASRKHHRVSGFLLRKQISASTIPLRNQVRPKAVAGSRTSSTLVVDMLSDGDVTAVAASSLLDASVGSTRSLPSRNYDDGDDVDDCLRTQCESAL